MPVPRGWGGIWKPYRDFSLRQHVWEPVPHVGVMQNRVLKLQGRGWERGRCRAGGSTAGDGC